MSQVNQDLATKVKYYLPKEMLNRLSLEFTLLDLDDNGTPENYEEQNHYGDFLIHSDLTGDHRIKLWYNHPENQSFDGVWELEYCGACNRYTWETIAKYNRNGINASY